jgi:tetratricopeptide (TPR) repeat protein
MSDQINKIIDLIKQKSLANALKASTDLVQQYPNNLNVNKIYGYVLMLCQKFSESEQVYLKLQKKITNDYDISNNLGYIYLQEERFSDSQKFLKKALEINPGGVNACANMAALLLKTIKYDEALEYYQKFFLLIDGEKNYNLEHSAVILGYLDTLVALGQRIIGKRKDKNFPSS